ncbi:MAG: outer membrane beta-barrel protein, partial [Bacteroidota bacterium]
GFSGGGGGMGSPGGGGSQFIGGNAMNNFLVGQQSGITTTNSVGTNYTAAWGSHLNVNQSYFFNLTNGENAQKLTRQNYGTPDSSTAYNENTDSDTRNYNHRIDSRFEYTADSSNSVIEQPRLYFQNNHSTSDLSGLTSLASSAPINQTQTDNQSTTNGYNLTNHLVYRHKFDTPGRTVSIDFGSGLNRKQGTTLQQSYSAYYRDTSAVKDTTNQQTPILTDGYTLSSRLAYTEPLASSSQLQFTYNPSYTMSEADNRKYKFNLLTQGYTDEVNYLSNTYKNAYTTNNGGIAYRFRATGFNFMAGASYQIASLRGEQDFPFSNMLNKSFANVLPNAMLTYNFADHSNLRIFYRTSTSPPQISQLQNVVDNSNPLLLSTGNPDLKQSFSQSFITRISSTNPGDFRSWFLFLTLNYTGNYIANSTLTASNDTVLARGIRLNRGTQLTMPVNLDGYWNARTFLTYSLPAAIFSSNLNLNTELTYTRTPGMINSDLNLTNTYVISEGGVLSSNISQDVDFTLSYTGNYNISRNSAATGQDNHYFNHTAAAKFNLIFWNGIVFRNELTNILYSGLSGGYNQNYVLWNIALGKKFLDNQRGEVRVAVNDLLKQNQSVNRTITETYVEDTQSEVLSRYVLLTFTYTVR